MIKHEQRSEVFLKSVVQTVMAATSMEKALVGDDLSIAKQKQLEILVSV